PPDPAWHRRQDGTRRAIRNPRRCVEEGRRRTRTRPRPRCPAHLRPATETTRLAPAGSQVLRQTPEAVRQVTHFMLGESRSGRCYEFYAKTIPCFAGCSRR